MKRWRAPRDPRIIIYFLAALGGVALLVVGGLRLQRIFRGPIEAWPITLNNFALAFGWLLVLTITLVLLWRARYHASLGYEMDRNAIYVLHGRRRYVIPLDRISAISGAEAGARERVEKSVQRFGYGGPARSLVVETNIRRYRLALVDRDQFLHELQGRQQLGIVQKQPEGWVEDRAAWRMLLRRPAVRFVLSLILVANVGVWALIAWRYPLLPDTVPLRFDPIGGTAGTRPKTSTLLLPLGATGLWLLNLVVALIIARRTRLASELLLVGTLILHIIVLVAAYFIVMIAV